MNDNMLTPGMRPSPPDARDHIASLPQVTVPTSVDLKPDVFEVENQGQINSCTANAGCSALELLYNKNKTPVDLSRLYLYYYTRLLGDIRDDGGSYPRDIGKALLNYGTCYEKNWAYDASILNTEPNIDAKVEAAQFKIKSYAQLTGDKLTGIKNALAQGVPVLLNIAVHQGFYGLFGSWKTHTWDYNTTDTNPIKGWHEILIIGYDDESQRLLVENSWGPLWGDGGFFGIPYDMINTPSFGELWVLVPNLDINYIPEPKTIDTLISTYFNTKNVGILILVASIATYCWNYFR